MLHRARYTHTFRTQIQSYMKMAKNSSRSSGRPICYSVRHVGTPRTFEHKIYVEADNRVISAFHDVPLHVNDSDLLNMVVEVPRWTNAKLEISKSEPLNPIVQDIKKGELRYVANVFPFKGYIQTYGAFPQTWEDPSHINYETQCRGDNDPLDVVEIGMDVGYTGQIKQVKVLGCLGLIDDGETDWKIIAIDAQDPAAEKLNEINDVETHMPGLLDGIRSWFKNYKVPDGKPVNEFSHNGEYRDKAFALKTIQDCHQAWKKLITKNIDANVHGISVFRECDDISIPRGSTTCQNMDDKPHHESIAYLSKL